MQGGELTINTTTKVMKGKKVLFTYAKPKTFKFTKASVTLKRGTANTDLSRSDKSVFTCHNNHGKTAQKNYMKKTRPIRTGCGGATRIRTGE